MRHSERLRKPADLPRQRLFLHLGPPKTGTTFVQSLLERNEPSFRNQGIVVVGTQAEHHEVANEVMVRMSPRAVEVPRGALNRMRRRVTGSAGDVVISCERYSMLRATHARRLRDAFAGCEIHVVFTLRDPAAVLPSIWQEGIKNGSSTSWSAFCSQVTEREGFMMAQIRARRPLNAWSQVLRKERIHIVTVPGPSAPRTLLLERLCEVIGADHRKLVTREATRPNRSMDLVGAELIRRLNASERCRLSPHVQRSEIKSFLVGQVLADRPPLVKPALTADAFRAARAEAERLVTQVRRGGYPIVGDLADLTSVKPPSPEDHLGHVEAASLVEPAVESIVALSVRSYERAQELTGLGHGSIGASAARRLRRLLPRPGA